jgi:hypothetical protein
MSLINLPAARQIRRSPGHPFSPFALPRGRVPRVGRERESAFRSVAARRGNNRGNAIQRSTISRDQLSRQRRLEEFENLFSRFLLRGTTERERDPNLLESTRCVFPRCIQSAFIYQRRLAERSFRPSRMPSRLPSCSMSSEGYRSAGSSRDEAASISVETVASKLRASYSFGTSIRVSRASDFDSYRADGVSIDVHAYRGTTAMQDSR